MEQFKEKLIRTLNICNFELRSRREGKNGESTVEQLEQVIIPELVEVIENLDSNRFPPKEQRYLKSFACAFTVWGWNMQTPTELFVLLTEINNEYKNI